MNGIDGMVTLVFICNKCRGKVETRTFEVQYSDSRTASEAGVPVCPRCGRSEHVTRFFGHNIFMSAKSNRAKLPAQYQPMDHGRKKAVVSIGMRLDEDERREFRQAAESMPQNAEIITDPDRDLPEEVLGLRKGTVDRALFDAKQKKLIEDLDDGLKISGFVLPLTGDSNN